MNRDVAESGVDWRERVSQLQAELEILRPQLINAEAQLAEQLAAISAFEFRLRARLGQLSRRLDDIQRDIDELRRQLRRTQSGWVDVAGEAEAATETSKDSWRFDAHDKAASSGNFRYRDNRSEVNARPLESEQQARLKVLFRQLARRFHPDLALDEADREYRTGLMMAINAAYSAGDLERLEQLSLEPDSAGNVPATDGELFEALSREVERCRRRLNEILTELAMLEQHPNARLLRRSDRATAEGYDLINEMAKDLRRQLAEKMVERDVLETQLEEIERLRGDNDDEEPDAEELARIVYNLGLEQAGEGDIMSPFGNWDARRQERWLDGVNSQADEDILDDSE